MIVAVVNLPHPATVTGERCRAILRNATRCESWARWSLVLDDGTEILVCLLHANAGVRRGELQVEGRAWVQREMFEEPA